MIGASAELGSSISSLTSSSNSQDDNRKKKHATPGKLTKKARDIMAHSRLKKTKLW
jgi:hypothetical protein